MMVLSAEPMLMCFSFQKCVVQCSASKVNRKKVSFDLLVVLQHIEFKITKRYKEIDSLLSVA